MAYGNFVQASDFDTPPLNLPNLSEAASTFPDFVAEQQELVLRDLLGNVLFEAFKAGLDEVDPEDRWLYLKNGRDYQYLGHTRKWVGMAALLKPYIYAQWLRFGAELLTGNGPVVSATENGTVVSSATLLSRAYNDFARKAGHPDNWCDDPCINTLYGFLFTSEEMYEDSIDGYSSVKAYIEENFKDPSTLNEFGI